MYAIGWSDRAGKVLLALCCLAAAEVPLLAQPAGLAPPRSPREFLTSPRQTVETLYFAVVAFDYRPQLMDEAVACLDLDPIRAVSPAEAARLAIDLEQVMRTLCVPLLGVPDRTEGDAVTVFDAEGFKVSLIRGTDGLWRFDRDTVQRIPAMNRAALVRYRSTQVERALLKDDCTDPSATLRRFLIDTIGRDFYSAARCLDLSGLNSEERGDMGPRLAEQLAFVVQRRGWVFLQEVPNQPSGPPFTWHADRSGRIALERVRLPDGKEAWLFNKKTVRNIPAMFEAVKNNPPDPRYVRLGVALSSLGAGGPGTAERRPASVPAQLGSPRAVLEAFFRVMDAAETQDSRLADALEFLDLQGLPPADRPMLGTRLASKLETVLRKIHVELSALPSDWNAPPQVLGDDQGLQVEIVRQRDGCWRFSRDTVARTPALFDKLAARDGSERERAAHLDSARDTMSTFLSCMRTGDYEQAATCLDLSAFRPGTQNEMGAVLAYKLKFIMDRIGRVYIQEVPETPDGPRYIFYRGELGRIVIARQADGPRRGSWLFTPETVALIEPMFRQVVCRPLPESIAGEALGPPLFWRTPGIWVRRYVPSVLRPHFWYLQLYQWLGLLLAGLGSLAAARLLLAQGHRLFALILRKSGSVLTRPFVAARLRPLTWVAAWWLLFHALALLDLPAWMMDAILPLKTFGLAALIAWLGVQVVNLVTAVYMNSELLRPHRSLGDMIVPVSMRSLKGGILLLVAVYVVYQIGEGDFFNRFLTGLGVAGLAASLAAQDALKSFFSTLLLIGERSFKIGDRVSVAGLEGVVEQVGFRATRLRTADGSLLTIPNSTIASVAIDNLSTKSFSRCKMSLLVNYDTSPEGILALRDRIRAWLLERPGIRADKVNVSVNQLTEKGVEVALDLYLTDVNGADKDLKEEINCEVLRMCASMSPAAVGRPHPLAGSDKAANGQTLRRGAA
jgi:MscS family membrane protein